MDKRIPNFFVVGAAKAGTTSLYNYLQAHPEVFLCPVKEPNFFSTDIDPDNFNKTYKKNTILKIKETPKKNVQLSLVTDEGVYRSLFGKVSDEIAIGECSTSYLYSTVAAKNINKFNPDAKIIILLRNPVERTFSHYLMALKYGFTRLSFTEALEKDMNAAKKGWGISELFIELSLYHEQLVRYFKLFSPEKIKVVLFEELHHNREKTLNDICAFLGVSEYIFNDSTKYNPAAIPRCKFLNVLIVHSGLKPLLSKAFSGLFTEKAKHLYYKHNKLPTLDKKNQARLQNIFRENILQTQDLIEKDLSHWL
jgi:hypothetical protein